MFKIELRACHLLKNEKEYNKKKKHAYFLIFVFVFNLFFCKQLP